MPSVCLIVHLDRIPKQVASGWYLSGVLTLPKDDYGRRVSQFPFEYIMVDVNKKNRNTGGTVQLKNKEKEEKTKIQEFQGGKFLAQVFLTQKI